MSVDASHLTPEAQATLELSAEQRIARIRAPRWVGYTRAQEVLTTLKDLLNHPKTHRMPGMLLVGESNNGKTFILRRFRDLNPPSENPAADAFSIPVLLVQTPPVPDEGRLYNAILDEVNAVYRLTDRVEKKQYIAVQILRRVKLRMLAIDEIQAALAGSEARRHAFLNVIRYLANELQIPIVLSGTKDAFRAVGSERSIANRFEPAVLPAWTNDMDYLRLLASFQRMLPLANPSSLTSPEIAGHLLQQSEGILGELAELLRRAAIKAVESKTERITLDVLRKVRWQRPSERRNAAREIR